MNRGFDAILMTVYQGLHVFYLYLKKANYGMICKRHISLSQARAHMTEISSLALITGIF